jgi:hypothetical protein
MEMVVERKEVAMTHPIYQERTKGKVIKRPGGAQ